MSVLFTAILIHLAAFTAAQPRFVARNCSGTSNYTSNSTYETNLMTLLNYLSSDTKTTTGFYNLSLGQQPDVVNVVALCRADVRVEICRSCINNSITRILQVCPNKKEAIGFYEYCMLQFSDQDVYNYTENESSYAFIGSVNARDINGFNREVTTLTDNLISRAASSRSIAKFATGNYSGSNLSTIYGLVQCTPELSEKQCTDCLNGARAQLFACCIAKVGARSLRPSCNLRYETSLFYNYTDYEVPSVSLLPPARKKGKSNSARTVIIAAVSVIIALISAVCIIILVRSKKQRRKFEDVEEITNVESLQFDFETIRLATGNFSDDNKLGRGGFGAVYKGRLPNEQDIAVKRLAKNSGQGDLEFKNEVLLVAKLQHRNLVKLLGFCLDVDERLLIYEYMPNASLDYFIFDPTKRRQLDWGRRYKIIGGIARGLLYLHEDSRLRIIHRDLKTSNILLDAEMNPKISDFGMARLFLVDQTQGNTNRIVGTYGYMAPEYAMHGYFSVKSDVFSYGVLVLEILSGQRNSYFCEGDNMEDLLSYAWKNWNEGTSFNMIDPILRDESRDEIMRCIHIGLLCVQENVASRPTMAQVVVMLNSFSVSLPVPAKPTVLMRDNNESSAPSMLPSSADRTESSSRSKSFSHGGSITDQIYPR